MLQSLVELQNVHHLFLQRTLLYLSVSIGSLWLDVRKLHTIFLRYVHNTHRYCSNSNLCLLVLGELSTVDDQYQIYTGL